MAMLVIDSLTVNVSIDGGLESAIEDLTDRARSIAGSLLVTQLTSTAGASKETLACRTIPYTSTDRDTLLAKLRSAATLAVTGDIGSRTVSAVIRGIRPIIVAGAARWIVSFDLIEV